MADDLNTHGVIVTFGRHKGKLLTRVPASYLKFMVNEGTPQADLAKAEIERRGHKLPKVEISGHAMDSASIRVRKIWHQTREKNEGLHSWLQRITLEAIENSDQIENGKYRYNGMNLTVFAGEEFPILKTITRIKSKDEKIPCTKIKKSVLKTIMHTLEHWVEAPAGFFDKEISNFEVGKKARVTIRLNNEQISHDFKITEKKNVRDPKT